MKRIHLLSAAAGFAILGAAPLAAQTTTAPATPPATTVPAPATAAPTPVGPEAREGVEEAAAAVPTAAPPPTSQGADNASVTGQANASTSSALASAGKPELNAVVGGTAVIGTGGTSIGTVNGRVKNQADAIVGLRVKLTDGTTTTIPASELTLTGSTLSTTWVAKK